MLSLRTCRSLTARLNRSRRLLATETPHEPSLEFQDEERRKFGRKEKDILSKEEQQERFTEFLAQKAQEKPRRPQLQVEIDPEHGLWAFFRLTEKDGKRVYESIEENKPGITTGSGRAWRSFELRRKSFKDLHTLWYIVLRERNLLATQYAEAKRLSITREALAVSDKEKRCRKSMARIKQIMNERRLAYEHATRLRNSEKAVGAYRVG